MEVDSKNSYIGVFDSGMGGISVLAEIINLMPNEKYIYYGDSLNAPYGIKSKEEVIELSTKVCEFLIKKGVKAIVVACNTATSAAISELRNKFNIPIIGMEPAIKPALEVCMNKKIAVMATPMTLDQKKFNNLLNKLTTKDKIIKIPAPELVEFVESGDINSNELQNVLKNYFKDINLNEVGAIVLGCTHFVFLKELLKGVVGERIIIIDGNYGTAKHLKNTLKKLKALRSNNEGEVLIYNSKKDYEIIELSKDLLKKVINNKAE